MKILVCGGSGFIGSAFIRNYVLNNPESYITNLDNLTIGSNQENLKNLHHKLSGIGLKTLAFLACLICWDIIILAGFLQLN